MQFLYCTTGKLQTHNRRKSWDESDGRNGKEQKKRHTIKLQLWNNTNRSCMDELFIGF